MIKKIINKVALKVSYIKGTDDKGNDVIKAQSFKNISLVAPAEDLHGFGDLVSKLLNYEVSAFATEEDHDLIEQAA